MMLGEAFVWVFTSDEFTNRYGLDSVSLYEMRAKGRVPILLLGGWE